MHEFASYNREILSISEINLSAISSAALYGRGVFTTLAVYNKQPFLWEKHWKRVVENARRIGINLSDFSEESVSKSLVELIEKNEIQKGRVRITFFDTSANSIWKAESKIKTTLLIQTADFRSVSNNLHLTISPFQINSASPLANVKSCNYLENILALENAKTKGFDEAVRLNERGEVASACMANIFWLKEKKLFSPALETGCLAGITREFIIETAEKNGVEWFFVKTGLSELLSADEVFLTSSGLNIANVEKIDSVLFKKPEII